MTIFKILLRMNITALAVLFWLAFASESAYSSTYFVAVNGSDSNVGTESLPWKTISKAASNLVAGDTVYIKAGTYQEQVIPANSGTANNYITYATNPGDTVTIDGANIVLPAWGTGLFHVEDISYIKISGLRMINAGPNSNNTGIYVDNSSYIIIENNYTYNTVSSGIGVWNSSNITLDGNEVVLACNDGEQEDISVSATNTFVIKNNHVHDGGPGTNGGEGITIKDGSTNGKIYNNNVHHLKRLGIYIDAEEVRTYDIDVFQNNVHDNLNDGITLASERGGLLENITVYNNIAYNNKNNGISVTPNGTVSNPPMNDIKIINNTFYNNGLNGWGGGVAVDNPNVTNLTIRNNIVSQNLNFQILMDVSVQNLTADYNLIDGYRGYPNEIYGSSYVEGDPLFVNPSGANFRLQGSSPAIDKGYSTDAPGIDYDGNSRPRGTGHDIGAFEFSGSGSSEPSPDIKANGSDRPVVINSSEALTITISCNAGGNTQQSDWWLAVLTSFNGWYYYNLNTGWTVGPIAVTYQGPLIDISEITMLNNAGLPVGEYTFYFAVDTINDGFVTNSSLYLDSVAVTIN